MTITNPYGATQNMGLEDYAMQQLRGMTTAMGQTGTIDYSFVSSIINDPNTLAFLVNALTYGGYSTGDIINEIKRLELKSKGDQNASKLKIIDPELTRTDYLNTADGAQSVVDTRQYIPTIQLTGNINPEILKYGINMPDEAFKVLVPILDQESDEFKKAVEGVKASFYDLTMQQLQADTEQSKAIADTNMENFKKEIGRQYGIALSDNANTAWKQLETLGGTMEGRGLRGSGMESEAVDRYLRSVRDKDAQNRQARLTREDSEMASSYKSSATSEQIKALIAEDQAKGLPKEEWRATKWGLVPSDDILQKYSLENLKKLFPDANDVQLQSYRDAVLDENGNYRSTLYSNYYSNLVKTQTGKKSYQESVIQEKNLKEDERMRETLEAGDPFASVLPKDKAAEEKIVSGTPSLKESQKPWTGEQTPEARVAAYAAAGIPDPSKQQQLPQQPARKTSEQLISEYQPKIDEIQKAIKNIQKNREPQGSTTPITTTSVTPTTSTRQTGATSYQIKSGDTLNKIAAQYGTTTKKLAELNKIADPNKIFAGQSLKLY